MEYWMIYTIVAIVFVMIELFFPTMFCINFAFAAIVTAVVSLFWGDVPSLICIFIVLSVISLVFLKPLFVKLLNKKNKVDFEGQYKDKVVKVIEKVTKTNGAVTIYDERWEARLASNSTDEEIPVGTDVKIVSNESTIFFVEKA